MFYRENGQFKTSYRADQQIFPIAQDRIVILAFLAVAFVLVPMLASDYIYRAILIPLVIMSMAALGVNILVGYCGQISLGSGAFMAVGAYGAFNFFVRFPGMPLIPALILGGLCATFFGILFGLPSNDEARVRYAIALPHLGSLILKHDLHAQLGMPEHCDEESHQRHRVPRLGNCGGGGHVIGAEQAEHEHQEPDPEHHQRGGGQALGDEMRGAGLGRTEAADFLQRSAKTAHAPPPTST